MVRTRSSKSSILYFAFRLTNFYSVALLVGVPENHVIVLSLLHDLQISGMCMPSHSLMDTDVDELECLAEADLALGNIENASRVLQRVLMYRDAKMNTLPSGSDEHVKEQLTTACTLEKVSTLFAMKGDTVQAEKAYNDSVRLREAAGKFHDENVYKKEIQNEEIA
jgi:hypothetical protein